MPGCCPRARAREEQEVLDASDHFVGVAERVEAHVENAETRKDQRRVDAKTSGGWMAAVYAARVLPAAGGWQRYTQREWSTILNRDNT